MSTTADPLRQIVSEWFLNKMAAMSPDGWIDGLTAAVHEWIDTPVGPEEKRLDRALHDVCADLDERLALRIADTLGERFGWTNEEKDEALTLVLCEIARWWEPEPKKGGA